MTIPLRPERPRGKNDFRNANNVKITFWLIMCIFNKMSRRKRRHLKSPRSLTVSSASRSHSGCVLHQGMHAIDSCPFHSMTIWPPIPEIQFDHENSRLKVKVKGTPVSTASFWLISLVFHIRAYYRLPSLLFHDNRDSPSRDTIWPWKFKVKGQGQRYPSQRSVLLTHFLSVSHQGILSTPVPFVPWLSGLLFPRYNLTLKIQGQRSRSKVPQSAQHPLDSIP